MKSKSFTLIELLVVIVIIGILAGVIMISTSSSIDKANITKLKVFDESVQNNLAANMVSAWDADHVTKGATWVLNDKWGNNNGTFYDTISTCSTTLCPQVVTDNQMGNVLYYDGVNDYIDLGNKNFDYNEFTISLWSKCVTNSPTIPGFPIHVTNLIGKGNWNEVNDWYLGYWSTGTSPATHLSFGYGIGCCGSGPSYSVNNFDLSKWNHIVGVATLTKQILYLNGAQVSTISTAHTSIVNGYNLQIARSSYTGRFFNGSIGDVKVYNAALSSSQIKQNYIAGLDSLLSDGNISKKEYNERINEFVYE